MPDVNEIIERLRESGFVRGSVIDSDDHVRVLLADAVAAVREAAQPDPPEDEREAVKKLADDLKGIGVPPGLTHMAAERWRDEYIARATARPIPAPDNPPSPWDEVPAKDERHAVAIALTLVAMDRDSRGVEGDKEWFLRCADAVIAALDSYRRCR